MNAHDDVDGRQKHTELLVASRLEFVYFYPACQFISNAKSIWLMLAIHHHQPVPSTINLIIQVIHTHHNASPFQNRYQLG